METETKASRLGKPQRFLSFSKSDAVWFVFGYVVCFLILRFDIGRVHPFQNPMPTSRAAWVAVPFTLLIEVLVRIRNR
jgi:hypothetical protein